MKTKYFRLNAPNTRKSVWPSSYYNSSLQSSTTFFTQLFSVIFSAIKNLKTIGINASSLSLSLCLNTFNSSVEWLNQLLLTCVSVFVLRGGYQNVAI